MAQSAEEPGGRRRGSGPCDRLMTKTWVERQMRHQLEDFKGLAEVTVPVPV